MRRHGEEARENDIRCMDGPWRLFAIALASGIQVPTESFPHIFTGSLVDGRRIVSTTLLDELRKVRTAQAGHYFLAVDYKPLSCSRFMSRVVWYVRWFPLVAKCSVWIESMACEVITYDIDCRQSWDNNGLPKLKKTKPKCFS